MKIRNIIAYALLLTCIAVPTDFAVQPKTVSTAVDYETASGLIAKCSLSCSDSDGMLKIYAKTQASGFMNKIGFVNIIIQKSSDLINWSDEKNIGDFIESNKKYYTLNHTESVTGGFYYRIVCTHYADGMQFWNGSSAIQTASNTSKAVWISPQPEVTTTTTTQTTSATKSKTTSADTSTVTNNIETAISDMLTSSNTTVSRTSQTYTSPKTSSAASVPAKSENSPRTSSNLPVSAFTASAIALITAFLCRKKSK